MSQQAKLEKLAATQFDGEVDRIYDPEHGAFETIGSFLWGGRWNRKQQFGALYTSLGRPTAENEILAQARKRGVEPSDLGPRDHVEIHAKLTRVLDLTTDAALKALSVSKTELLANRELCLEIADAARLLGVEGLIVPSAESAGKNLVIFMDKLQPGWELKELRRNRNVRLGKKDGETE